MEIDTSKIKILLCTPVHSSIHINYHTACLDFQKECIYNNIQVSFQYTKSSLVTQARQLLVSKFLNSDATHLFFVDSDIQFNFKIFAKMLLSDKDVILTPYPLKDFNSKLLKDRLDLGIKEEVNLLSNSYAVGLIDYNKVEVQNGVVEIDKGPAGCMLIKREVFKKLIEKFPHYKITQPNFIDGKMVMTENVYNFFDTYFKKEDNTYHGEDFYFCNLCKEVGIKVYALIDEYITHHGEYGYKGRYLDELLFSDIKNKLGQAK